MYSEEDWDFVYDRLGAPPSYITTAQIEALIDILFEEIECRKETHEEIRQAVNLWRGKKTLSARGDMDSLVSFTEAMNALSRTIISAFDEKDPEFFDSLAELSNNASTLTTKEARIFVNGQDRTNL